MVARERFYNQRLLDSRQPRGVAVQHAGLWSL